MKKITTLLAGIFLTTSILEAQTIIDDSTEVYGTWTKVNSPYLIHGLAIVPTGNTLIIEPGVEIRFKTGTDYSYSDNSVDVGLLYIKGKLIANGTSSQQITLTRQGDSGNWGCIAFAPTADVSSSLKYCKVEYAKYILDNESGSYIGAISFRNPKISISNSEILNNGSSGIYSDRTTFSIYNCIIANNKEHGFNLNSAFEAKDTVKLINNTIIGNASSGLYTRNTRCQVINCIFWGNAESFAIYNYYTFIYHSLVEEYSLPDYGGWLKIGDGMIYNFNPQLNSDYSLPYYSRCINAGIPNTSGLSLPETDIAGNNRINLGRIDMGAFESSAEKFICITKPLGHEGFLTGTTQEIKWVSNAVNIKLEYTSDGGVTWNNIVTSTPNDGLFNWIIPPVESKYCDLRISDVSDNSFFDLCNNNFSLFTSNIPDSTILSGRLTTVYSPYNFNGLITVPAGDTLIIDPGVEIRFKTGSDYSYSTDDSVNVGLLYVKGNVIAEGTSNQRITFTRQGDSGNWGCIAFAPNAGISSSLKYSKIEFAYCITDLESVEYYGALSLRNPNISITHCEIITNNRDGIYSYHTTFHLKNCIIANNRFSGINIISAYKSNDIIVIANNTVVGNGSQGLASTAKCNIVNNVFWNTGSSIYVSSNTSVASYNLVKEDIIVNSYLVFGEGMVYNYDPHLGSDFYPLYNSPAINTGTPDTSGLNLSGYDFWGNDRINQSRVDMGAVESDATKLIWLISPNGKEGFFAGTNQQIRWKSNIENLKLEYTIDNGIKWIEITGSTQNDGTYNWNIPSVESESYNIRISDVTDNSLFDTCDNNFRVITSIIPDSTILTGRLTIENSPYYINGLVTVPPEDSLIIDPGVEIRFKTGDNAKDVGSLRVKGKLTAEGTLNQWITLTRQGDQGIWGCIVFEATANTSSSIKYCKVEYAGYTGGAVTIRNPKVSISYSEITLNNASGIYCKNSNPLIQNCIIADNKTNGVWCGDSNPVMQNCVIANNQNNGVTSEGSTPLVKNCLIVKNGKDGINIWSAFNSKDTIFITNNTIVGNGLTGLYDNYAKCKIVNNIFWNNKESINKYYLSSYILSYNLVQEDNLTASSVTIGAGMIYNLDPQFVNSDNNDYHLKATSPCIDAGDPGYDWDLESYDNGGRINIGAYGNTIEAAKTEYLPRINYLSVKYGRMFGRDTLIIKGAHFLSGRGNGTIKFGSIESSEYLYWSDDSIVCITPPHLPETVDINIVNSDAKTGVGKNCFSFLPPVLDKPDPIFSNNSGGQQIILSGELFGHSQNGIQVLFDHIEAPLYPTWNDTLIKLNCPAHPEGLVDLLFRLNDSIYYNFDESFLYSDKPLIELCGEISDTLFNSQTYLLTCPVTIPENQTLVIEPGVLIIAQYDEDTLISITSNGIIEAIGNKSDSIKIISFPQYKGTWQGIILKKQGSFDYCIIKNGINGISVEKGKLELKNSTIANNFTAGLDLEGLSTTITLNAENINLINNNYGIYARATFTKGSGSVSATFSSCNILDNNEYGIDLYSHGAIGGTVVSITSSANINITLKNSVVSKSGSNAIKIRSYGFESSSYSPHAHRYGHVNLISENSIISDNGYGITTQRENTTHCFITTRFYNTVMYNNNSVIEMDADYVFIYNTNLWDNGVSGNPVGFCDSLVVVNSNLNSLENILYGRNNISINPVYISPGSGDFHLSHGSPCIDAGSNQFVSFETDFDGKVRIWNATDKDSAIVDIGAFEYGTPCYATTIEKEICEGESYEGYTESGVYQFNYTNVSGCDSIIFVNLHVNPVPEKPTIVQNLDTLTSNAEVGNQWYLNNSAMTYANSQKYIVSASGDYHVVIINEFGCVSDPSNIINVTYSLLENLKEYRVEVYPNPASEYIIVAGLQGNEEVEIAIYNLSGICIKQKIISSKEVRINIKDLKPGAYTLILNNLSKQDSFRYHIQKI
jgi:hypothetical protein